MNVDVRFHGRGGQGVVTAAELLSLAAFDQGLHAQALPSFGSERTGAPVVAFCRISEHPIRAHEPISSPDVLVVQDPTLLAVPGVLAGLSAQGTVIVNTARGVDAFVQADLGRGSGQRWVTIPATELARQTLGRPLPNTALLGALAGLTGVVSLESVQRAIRHRFAAGPQDVVEANVSLAAQAHDLVAVHPVEVPHA